MRRKLLAISICDGIFYSQALRQPLWLAHGPVFIYMCVCDLMRLLLTRSLLLDHLLTLVSSYSLTTHCCYSVTLNLVSPSVVNKHGLCLQSIPNRSHICSLAFQIDKNKQQIKRLTVLSIRICMNPFERLKYESESSQSFSHAV